MLYQKVIHYLAYVALILPALPPALFPFFQPYTFGKATLFEIVVEAMAIVWLIGRYHPFTTSDVVNGWWSMRRALVALMLAFIASTALSADVSASFWGSSARMDGLFTLLHFLAFFIILASSFRESVWRRSMQVSVVAGTFAALYAIAQWFNAPLVVASGGEVFGTLGNPSYLALYLLFTIFLAHHLAEREPRHPSYSYRKMGLLFVRQPPPVGGDWTNRENRREAVILLYCAAALQVIALLLTQVQAALLALVIGAVVVAYPYIRTHITLRRGVAALGAVGILILLFSFSANFAKIASFSEGSASLSNRIAVWNIALSGIAEKPILGHGANMFEPYYLTRKSEGTVAIPATGETFDKPHNAYLEIAFSYGTIGLIAYLFLLWAIMRRAWNTPALAGALAGYFVFLFFFFDTFVSLLMFFFVAAFLFLFSSPKENNSVAVEKTASPAVLAVGGIVLTTIFFIFHFKPLYSAYFARQFLVRASATRAIDETAKAKALRYHSFNAPFIERAIFLTESAIKSK